MDDEIKNTDETEIAEFFNNTYLYKYGNQVYILAVYMTNFKHIFTPK